MSKTKTKPKQQPKLGSWGDVNSALLRIKGMEAEIARLQGRLDKGTAALESRYMPDIADRQATLSALTDAVLDFVYDNRKDLSEDGDRRSRDLPAGRVGIYLTPARLATMSKVTWKKVLDRVLELPGALRRKFVRTKEELDKDAIRTAIEEGSLTEEHRRALGVAIVQDEKAFLELA